MTISREEEVIMDLLTCGGKDLGPLVFQPTEEEANAVFQSTSPHQDLTPEVAARRVRQLLLPLEALIHAVEKRKCAPREALQHALAILRAGLRQPIEERPQLLLSFPPASFSTSSPSFSSMGGRAQFLLHPTTAGKDTNATPKRASTPAKKKRAEANDHTNAAAQREEEEEEGIRRFAMVQEAWAVGSSPEGSVAVERLAPSLRPHNVVYHQLVSSRSVPLAGMVEGLYGIAYPSVKLRVELLCLLLRREVEEQGRALTEQVQARGLSSAPSEHGRKGTSSSSTTTRPMGNEKEAVEEQLAALLVTETLLTDFMAYYTNVIRYVGMSTAMQSPLLLGSSSAAGAERSGRGGGEACPTSSSSSSSVLPPTVLYTSPSTTPPSSWSSSLEASEKAASPLPASAAFPSTSAVKASLIRQYYELSDWILLVESTADIPPICLSQITRVHLQDGGVEGGERSATHGRRGAGAASRHPHSRPRTPHPKDEGVLRIDIRRPSTTTPWGLLFTQKAKLLDVDVAMRVGKHARHVHALLQRTDGGARILSVNGHVFPPPPLSPSEEREKQARKRSASTTKQRSHKDDLHEERSSTTYPERLAAYERHILQELHRITVSARKMVLEVRSPAFTAAAMHECPRELLFYVPFQGGEGATGQKATVVLHRRDAARMPWSFSIEAATTTTTPSSSSSSSASSHPCVLWHPPTPGVAGGAVFSDACRRFLNAFPNRLQLTSVNGVEVQTAGQAAALMGQAHTVVLQLQVGRPPTPALSATHSPAHDGRKSQRPQKGGGRATGGTPTTTTTPAGRDRVPAASMEEAAEVRSSLSQGEKGEAQQERKEETSTTTPPLAVVPLASLGEVAKTVAVEATKRRRGALPSTSPRRGQAAASFAVAVVPPPSSSLSSSAAVEVAETEASMDPPPADREETRRKPPQMKKNGADTPDKAVADGKEADSKRKEAEGTTEKKASGRTGPSGKGRDRPMRLPTEDETEKKMTTKEVATMGVEGEGEGKGETSTTIPIPTTTARDSDVNASSSTPCECVNAVRILSLDAKELVMERPSTDIPWGLPIKLRSSPSESVASAVKGKQQKRIEQTLPLEIEDLPPLRPWPQLSVSDSKRPLPSLSLASLKSGKKGKSSADWKVSKTMTTSDSSGDASMGAGGVSPSSAVVTHPFQQRFHEQKNWPILTVNGVKVKDSSQGIQLMKSLTKMTLRFAR